MPHEPEIAAIDLGTDKCVTLMAVVDEATHQLRVVGLSAIPSRGLRKSAIVDLEQALQTVTESVEATERMAGFNLRHAYVSVAGTHVESQNSKGVVAVAAPNQEINHSDVFRVIEAARAVSLPPDRTILHVIPRDFKVDSQNGIKDPLGMMGIRLEAEAHIVTGMSTTIRNLEKCLHDAGISVDGFVFAGLASSETSSTDTERELGVVVVDIGAGSTSICAFVEGVLELSTSLPVGARHITQDIALGCRLSLAAAEKIKLTLTSEQWSWPEPRSGESKDDLAKRRRQADKLDLTKLGLSEEIGTLSRQTTIESIISPRLKEICQLTGDLLHRQQLFSLVPAGLIFTGGGAETVGLIEIAKKTLHLPARLGQPTSLKGLTVDFSKPTFSTSVGLLLYGWHHTQFQPPATGFNLGRIWRRLAVETWLKKGWRAVRALLP